MIEERLKRQEIKQWSDDDHHDGRIDQDLLIIRQVSVEIHENHGDDFREGYPANCDDQETEWRKPLRKACGIKMPRRMRRVGAHLVIEISLMGYEVSGPRLNGDKICPTITWVIYLHHLYQSFEQSPKQIINCKSMTKPTEFGIMKFVTSFVMSGRKTRER